MEEAAAKKREAEMKKAGRPRKVLKMPTAHPLFAHVEGKTESDPDALALPSCKAIPEGHDFTMPFLLTDCAAVRDLMPKLQAGEWRKYLVDFQSLFDNHTMKITEGRASKNVTAELADVVLDTFRLALGGGDKSLLLPAAANAPNANASLANHFGAQVFALAAGHESYGKFELHQMGCVRFAISGFHK
eukprot:1320635-Alexandrium_andersonii.AAC.1